MKFYWDPTFVSSLSDSDLVSIAAHEKMHLEMQRGVMIESQFQEATARIDAFARREECPDPNPEVKTAGVVFETTSRLYPAGNRELFNIPGSNLATGESAAALEAVMQDFVINRPDAKVYCVDVSGSVNHKQLDWVGKFLKENLQSGDVVLAFAGDTVVVETEDVTTNLRVAQQLIGRMACDRKFGGFNPERCIAKAREFTAPKLVLITDGLILPESSEEFDEVIGIP